MAVVLHFVQDLDLATAGHTLDRKDVSGVLDLQLLAGSCPLSAIATRRAGRRKTGIVAERAHLGSPHPGGEWLEQVEHGLSTFVTGCEKTLPMTVFSIATIPNADDSTRLFVGWLTLSGVLTTLRRLFAPKRGQRVLWRCFDNKRDGNLLQNDGLRDFSVLL